VAPGLDTWDVYTLYSTMQSLVRLAEPPVKNELQKYQIRRIPVRTRSNGWCACNDFAKGFGAGLEVDVGMETAAAVLSTKKVRTREARTKAACAAAAAGGGVLLDGNGQSRLLSSEERAGSDDDNQEEQEQEEEEPPLGVMGSRRGVVERKYDLRRLNCEDMWEELGAALEEAADSDYQEEEESSSSSSCSEGQDGEELGEEEESELEEQEQEGEYDLAEGEDRVQLEEQQSTGSDDEDEDGLSEMKDFIVSDSAPRTTMSRKRTRDSYQSDMAM
jgi:hypothetical protein